MTIIAADGRASFLGRSRREGIVIAGDPWASRAFSSSFFLSRSRSGPNLRDAFGPAGIERARKDCQCGASKCFTHLMHLFLAVVNA
ncbi:MAG TPA: hypothetical protein VLT33_30830 [Labilithrix sp.]|nr:hypothetical protein [Labilithrix sp.]